MSGKLETEPLRRGPFISILLPAGSVGASQVVVGSYVGDAHGVGGVVNFGAGAEGDYSEEPLAATTKLVHAARVIIRARRRRTCRAAR